MPIRSSLILTTTISLLTVLPVVLPMMAVAQTTDNPALFNEFDATAQAALEGETAVLGDSTTAEVAYFIGMNYERGSRGTSLDERISEAERAYLHAARVGHQHAMMGMARVQVARLQNVIMGNRSGLDIERDLMYWVNQAADLGLPDALLSRAEILADGRFGQAQDHPKVLEDLTLAAEQNHAQAQKLLGWALFQGSLGITDYAQAQDWLGRAATAGDQEAASMLQRIEQGLGSFQSPDFLFTLAAGYCVQMTELNDAQSLSQRLMSNPPAFFSLDPQLNLPAVQVGTNRILVGLQNQGLTFFCTVVVEGRADWFTEKATFMIHESAQRQPDITMEDGSVWQHYKNFLTDWELGNCAQDWRFSSAVNGLQHRLDYSWNCI